MDSKQINEQLAAAFAAREIDSTDIAEQLELAALNAALKSVEWAVGATFAVYSVAKEES